MYIQNMRDTYPVVIGAFFFALSHKQRQHDEISEIVFMLRFFLLETFFTLSF